MGKISVVVGGQYGSEAKGHCAGWLASPEQNRLTGDYEEPPVVGVRVGGPNAGHVVWGKMLDSDADEWVEQRFALQQIPVAAVTNREAQLVIAAGSEIDPAVLLRELDALDAAGFNASARLVIDPQATLLEPKHVVEERNGTLGSPLPHGESGLTKSIGSTGKGVGAARADRLMRRATTFGGWVSGSHGTTWKHLAERGVELGDTAEHLRDALAHGAHVVIEGTQGYGLGLHAGNYPYCTSGDCRAIDFLAQAGVNPWQGRGWNGLMGGEDGYQLGVWVVLRPYPIRVAGNSGPLEDETSWEELGLPEERTTVTQKVRRVGAWDPELARAAVQANGGSACKIFLSMVDQVVPAVTGWTDEKQRELRGDITQQVNVASIVAAVERDTGARVHRLGTGPRTSIAWRQ